MFKTLTPALCVLGLTAGACAGTVTLLDQIGTPDGNDILVGNMYANQYFEAAYSQYDVATVDDFMNNDANSANTVSAVIGGWNGYAGISGVQGVQINFYNTLEEAAENLVGYISEDFPGTPEGDPDWPLTGDGLELLTMTGGPWAVGIDRQTISFIPINEFGSNGQTGMAGSVIGDNIAWQVNPGGGFGFGPWQEVAANPAIRVLGGAGNPCDSALPAECTGDVAGSNGPDHLVNVDDLLAVIGHFGEVGDGTYRPIGDCAPMPTGDCLVNVDDVLTVIGQFGDDCTPTGACCNGFSPCTVVSEADCLDSPDAIWLGEGAACDECAYGACCTESGACSEGYESACADTGGTFHASTDCATADCQPVTGACCLDAQTCLDNLTPSDCASFAGDFVGDGSDCTDAPCGWPGCSSGDTAEGVPCQGDTDGNFEDPNGGTNSDPPSFGSISDGETICGFMSTFTCIGCGDDGSDVTYRDTDWYTFENAAGGTYTIRAGGQGPLLVGIIQISTASWEVVATTEAYAQVELTATIGAGDDYAVFIAHDFNAGYDVPCGGGQNEYTVSFYGDAAPDSACCVGTDCAGDLSPIDCDALGGTYVGDESCATYLCPEAYAPCDTGIGHDPFLAGWWAGTSDNGAGYVRFENVDTASISSLRVWGIQAWYSGGWSACVDPQMQFDVTAFSDDGTGQPGDINAQLLDVIADVAAVDVDFGAYTLSRFDFDLVSTVPTRWISVASNGNGCWFLWINGSAENEGTSLLFSGGAYSEVPYDLSYCITP
jgi:hypothetical protein